MMASGSIALNFLRENRWPVLILLAWIVFTAVATAGFGRERVVAGRRGFLRAAAGGVHLRVQRLSAANAIHNERKSRRILLVLSKAVSRGEYLLAMLLGTLAMAVVYAVLFAACCTWLAHRAGLPTGGVFGSSPCWSWQAPLSRPAVGMFFSTFLNPYLAIALTVTMFAAPGAGRIPNVSRGFAWSPACRCCSMFCTSVFARDGPWTGAPWSLQCSKPRCSGGWRRWCLPTGTSPCRSSRRHPPSIVSSTSGCSKDLACARE